MVTPAYPTEHTGMQGCKVRSYSTQYDAECGNTWLNWCHNKIKRLQCVDTRMHTCQRKAVTARLLLLNSSNRGTAQVLATAEVLARPHSTLLCVIRG
jgi:hypothetical protein